MLNTSSEVGIPPGGDVTSAGAICADGDAQARALRGMQALAGLDSHAVAGLDPQARARRDFLVGGACLLTVTLAGCERKVTAAQARVAAVPFRTLSSNTVAVLDALGEILLPGAAAAGLAHYIDHQLSGDPADSMLMIKYLGVAAPFAEFYASGLRATDALARAVHGKGFAELSQQQATALVAKMSGGQVEGWQGPPAGLFYFVLRSDAVDVVYGTKAGFEQLGVPYMAHIEPPTRWGE